MRPSRYHSTKEYVLISPNSDTDSDSDSSDTEDSICGFCERKVPPRHIRNDTAAEDEWVLCDSCLRWFHALCVNASEEDLLAEQYMCTICRNAKM